MTEGGAAARLAIQPRPDEIRRASIWLYASCQALSVPDDTVERLDLCLNEALANVLAHGSNAVQTQEIKLLLRVDGTEDGGTAVLELRDSGIEFDPISFAPQKIASSLAEASIGGLGLTLIHHNTDTLEYLRSEGINVLKLGFAWPRLGE